MRLLRPALALLLAHAAAGLLILGLAPRASAQPTPTPTNTSLTVNKTTSAITAPGNATRFASANGLLTLSGSNTFLTGATATFNAGSTLTLNGSLAGTPTGGTLSLANLTLTLPTSFVTLTGTQTLTNKTLTSPTLTTPSLGAATASTILLGDYTPAAYVGVGGNRTTMNFHGFEDWTVTNSTASPNLGYAAFDAKPAIIGSAANSHLVGFQSRPIYDGSGTIDDYFESFGTLASHTGTGTIAYARGVHIRDVSGSGTITSNIGLLIDSITRGSSANYAIYSTGGQNYFGGAINAVGGFTGNVGLGVTQANAFNQLTMTGSILSAEGTGFFQNLYYSGGWKYNANGFGAGIYEGEGNGNLIFATAPNNAGGVGAAATPITQMTILNAGGVLVTGGSSSTNNYVAIVGSDTAHDSAFKSGDGTNNWFFGLLGQQATDGAFRWYSVGGAGTKMTLSSAGNLTVAGAIIGTPSARSGAGAVPITALTAELTSTGVAQAITLANGTAGQVINIIHKVDGGSMVLTPATKIGFSTITFTAIGESVSLVYTSAGWAVVGSYLATIAP